MLKSDFMPVKYVPVKQHNFKNPDEAQYVAQWKSRGERNIHDISEDLSHASTLSPADVAAMMEGLIHVLSKTLAQGYIAQLGDFGSFYLALNAEAKPSPEEVTAKSIKGCKVYFRPGKRLKKIMEDVGYSKK